MQFSFLSLFLSLSLNFQHNSIFHTSEAVCSSMWHVLIWSAHGGLPSLRCSVFSTSPILLSSLHCFSVTYCITLARLHGSHTNAACNARAHTHTHIFTAPGSVSVVLSDTSGGGQRFDGRQWAVASQTSRNLWNNNCNEGIIWQLHGYDSMQFSHTSYSDTNTHTRANFDSFCCFISRRS